MRRRPLNAVLSAGVANGCGRYISNSGITNAMYVLVFVIKDTTKFKIPSQNADGA